jgi:uncharacterized membrane protein
MKNLIKWFINGVLVLAPIGITLYVLTYIFNLIDGIGKDLIDNFTARPLFGSGLLLSIGFVLLIGFVSNLWISKIILEWIERIISRFPLLKTIYSTVKEVIQSFVGEKKSFSKVVLVTDKDGAKRIGFLTTEDLSTFNLDISYVAVYIPHGFQVSGELKLYQRDQIEIVDTSVEEAMRFCLTAGVASKRST